MTLDFLSPGAATDGAIARSPMERKALAAGARFEVRDGWNVAVAYASPEEEADACEHTAGWADVSHLGKLEVQGEGILEAAGLELGRATRAADAWWCPLTRRRALVLSEPSRLADVRQHVREQLPEPANIVEVSTVFAALTLVGPQSREVFARFCAIDLRPQITPVGSVRPGSIARQPGLIVCEAPERYLFLFGWAIGEYMWTAVEDAGRHLQARPIGIDALAPLREAHEELAQRA